MDKTKRRPQMRSSFFIRSSGCLPQIYSVTRLQINKPFEGRGIRRNLALYLDFFS